MPWCPNCKNEYYEGITKCADCGMELVDSLDFSADLKKKGSFLSEDDKLRLAYVQKAIDVETNKDNYEVNDILEAFENTISSEEEKEQRQDDNAPRKGHYKNYHEKAEDNKSSAVTLLFVGGVGLLLEILIYFDVIPVPGHIKSNYMLLGVMGFLFLVFIVMGIVSAKNARKYTEEAKKENALSEELKAWCHSHFMKADIDTKLFALDNDIEEEQKYFKRFEYIKQQIKLEFDNINDDYLNRFIDEFYQELFESEL